MHISRMHIIKEDNNCCHNCFSSMDCPWRVCLILFSTMFATFKFVSYLNKVLKNIYELRRTEYAV